MMGYTEFRALVSQMMDAQRLYFREKNPGVLTQCKTLERRVRDELAGRNPQPGLFDAPVGRGDYP